MIIEGDFHHDGAIFILLQQLLQQLSALMIDKDGGNFNFVA